MAIQGGGKFFYREAWIPKSYKPEGSVFRDAIAITLAYKVKDELIAIPLQIPSSFILPLHQSFKDAFRAC